VTANEVTLSAHARRQAARRGLDEADLIEIARAPDQVIELGDGRQVRQSRRTLPPDGKEYLIRVIVEVTPAATVVITAYRTSRIDKYWRVP